MLNVRLNTGSFNIEEFEDLEEYWEPHRITSSFSAYSDLDQAIFRIIAEIR